MGQGVQQALQGGPRRQVHILSRGRSCLQALLGAVTPCSSGQSEYAGAAWRLFWLGNIAQGGRWRGLDWCRLPVVCTAPSCVALHEADCLSSHVAV